jgi:ABC-type sugar transport system ATPase subunit
MELHRLPEVFQIADRVTVLKDGEGQGTLPVAATNTDDLVRRMVGRSLELRHQDAVAAANPILLEVRNLSDPLTAPKLLLRNISFKVRRGEIVGLAGLAGAGRTELALAMFGARTLGAGEIFVAGRRVKIHSPREAIAVGLGYVPEDLRPPANGGILMAPLCLRLGQNASRRDGAIVAWHEVPGTAPPQQSRPVGYGVIRAGERQNPSLQERRFIA